MHAASRRGTLSLTSLPKYGEIENLMVETYLMVTIQSPLGFFLLVSMSIWALVDSLMAFTLQPPLPITRLINDAGIWIFFDLKFKL